MSDLKQPKADPQAKPAAAKPERALGDAGGRSGDAGECREMQGDVDESGWKWLKMVESLNIRGA